MIKHFNVSWSVGAGFLLELHEKPVPGFYWTRVHFRVKIAKFHCFKEIIEAFNKLEKLPDHDRISPRKLRTLRHFWIRQEISVHLKEIAIEKVF